MSNAQWRQLTYGLAVVFLALLVLVAILALGRARSPSGEGSVATPSTTASATAVPSGSSATSSPSVGPSGSAGPSSSASPSGTPVIPSARATVRGLGMDDPADADATPRVIVFKSEGPGDVAVRLQRSDGGRVKFCLIPGTLKKPVGEEACLRTAGSTLTGHSKGTKPFTWTVTLVAVKDATTPTVDLRIDWPVSTPRLIIRRVRLAGTDAAANNGLTVAVTGRAATGPLTLDASWDPAGGGSDQPYQASITDPATGAVLDEADGTGSGAELSADVQTGQRVEVTLLNPEPSAPADVLAELDLAWP